MLTPPGYNVHRIKVDEKAGICITTHNWGGLSVFHLFSSVVLWCLSLVWRTFHLSLRMLKQSLRSHTSTPMPTANMTTGISSLTVMTVQRKCGACLVTSPLRMRSLPTRRRMMSRGARAPARQRCTASTHRVDSSVPGRCCNLPNTRGHTDWHTRRSYARATIARSCMTCARVLLCKRSILLPGRSATSTSTSAMRSYAIRTQCMCFRGRAAARSCAYRRTPTYNAISL